ncbi:hypothetical protein SORBI_3010G074432, partial [Sorghum bicolor]
RRRSPPSRRPSPLCFSLYCFPSLPKPLLPRQIRRDLATATTRRAVRQQGQRGDIELSISSGADGYIRAGTREFGDGLLTTYDIVLYTDDDEWSTWKKIGDEVLHIELCKWADIMVIAQLSANTLAMIAGGLCDNLLTCIVRAWDYNKPLFVAPAMNTLMWNNPFREHHLQTINQLGIILIPQLPKDWLAAITGMVQWLKPRRSILL